MTQENDIFLGFKFCASNPELFAGLLCGAGLLPLTQARYFKGMDTWHKVIIQTAQKFPSLIWFPTKLGLRFVRVSGWESFLRGSYGCSPADMRVLDTPDSFDAIMSGAQTAASPQKSAYRTYCLEMIEFASCRWEADVLTCRNKVPVRLVCGLEDPAMSVETLTAFQEDYDWIDFSIHDDAGQFILFQKWQEFLEQIDIMWDRIEQKPKQSVS